MWTKLEVRPLSIHKLFRRIVFLAFMAISSPTWSADEVVLIQAVSSSGKSFIIGRGIVDGIVEGQEGLFNNRGASFYAIAAEVNRHHSLWKIEDQRGAVPFARGDFINFTRSVKDIWLELPKTRLQKEKLDFVTYTNWVLRTNLTWALGESVAEVDSQRQRGRQGFQLEGGHLWRVRRNVDFGLGLRFDREVSRLVDPAIDVITQRHLVTAEFNYHFAPKTLEESKKHFYLGLGGAFGISSTLR